MQKKVSELIENIIERKYGSDGNYGCNGNNCSNGKKTLIKQRKQRHQNIGKMVAATAERAAMTMTGRKRMALTEAKAAAMAAIVCRRGRDGSNCRKCGDSGSACTDGSNGRDSTDRSRDGSSSGGSNGSSNGGSNGGNNDASNRQDGRDDGSDCNSMVATAAMVKIAMAAGKQRWFIATVKGWQQWQQW